MPGMIQREMMPEQQEQGQPQEPQAPQAQQQPNQQAVERVVIAATKVIHDPKIRSQLIELMKQAGDPVKALVDATFLVVRQLFEKSNRSIPEDVLGAASAQVLQMLGELAAAAKLFQVTPELLQQAAQAGLQRLEQEEQAKKQAAPQPQAQPEQPAAQPQEQMMMEE